MTDSPVCSINLTYLRIPTNPNYHMSIKKSQAILKRFIDLKFSLWLMLSSENETMFRDTQNFFQLPLSSFLFPLSNFLFPLSSFLFLLSRRLLNFNFIQTTVGNHYQRDIKTARLFPHGLVFAMKQQRNHSLDQERFETSL